MFKSSLALEAGNKEKRESPWKYVYIYLFLPSPKFSISVLRTNPRINSTGPAIIHEINIIQIDQLVVTL